MSIIFITLTVSFHIWGIDETIILGQLPDLSFHVLDSYTMRDYSEISLLPSPHLSWVWKDIIANTLKWKHICVKCCSAVGYLFFIDYILRLYGIKNKLCRCFPERANVFADQVRILCNNKNIKLRSDFFNRLVINNRKWLHRTLSELFIVAYHLAPSARISEIQIKA